MYMCVCANALCVCVFICHVYMSVSTVCVSGMCGYLWRQEREHQIPVELELQTII